MRTLSQILTDANAVLDLEAAEPTSTELTTRANYANQAVWDAAATGQLSEFDMEYIGLVSCATVALPSDFREAKQNPQLLDTSGSWNEFELIDESEKYNYSTADDYSYVYGNAADGYCMYFNSFITDATLSVIYQRYPSGLATLTDVCELSDPQYVVRKIESYVLYSRADDRFQIAESRAETQLANMMGREMKSASGVSRDTKMKFRHPLQDLT
jgi:hypothetical protein